MEYRDPQAEFVASAAGKAYNFDRNIQIGIQGMFSDTGNSSVERFRMLEARYQPGVLVWYYNSKYDLRDNNPLINGGQGYLLVLNANKKELVMPGPWERQDLFDEEGYYFKEDQVGPMKDLVDKQRMEFVCFSHTDFYKYLEGIEAACENYKDSLNYLKKLKFGTKSLIFSREFVNEVHPVDYEGFYFVNRPYTHTTGVLTSLSTFRPAESQPFSPFNAFKIDAANGTLVKDEDFSQRVAKYSPISTFSDLKVSLPKNKDRWGDSANVEKKGFSFEVVEPSNHVVERYSNRENSQGHDFFERRPRAKIYFQMEAVPAQP